MPTPANPNPPAVQFIVPYTTDTAQIDEWLKVRDRCIYLTPEEVQYLLRTRAAEKIPDSQLNVPHLLDRYSIPTHDDKWALVVWKTFDHQGFIFPSGNAFAVDSQPGPDYFSTRYILLSAFDDPPPDPGEPH